MLGGLRESPETEHPDIQSVSVSRNTGRWLRAQRAIGESLLEVKDSRNNTWNTRDLREVETTGDAVKIQRWAGHGLTPL